MCHLMCVCMYVCVCMCVYADSSNVCVCVCVCVAQASLSLVAPSAARDSRGGDGLLSAGPRHCAAEPLRR
jgi:hypothetical protein